MDYLDEQILKTKWELERKKHDTLETGIYVEEELITFTQMTLPNSSINIYLPNQFVIMPTEVKNLKYPSKDAPDFIVTSLDSMVNICFNILPIILEDGGTNMMSSQFRNALKNINPAIIIQNQVQTVTNQGNEMSWFEFKGYTLDGQSYNRIYLIKMHKVTLHGIFNCPIKIQNQWQHIISKIFLSVEEDL
uniref:hypothetical protein n=1 Tax=Enterocloster clostridioformis TaxID=1531 RepID=UPI0025A5E39A|nr:hypothetical protein [Enterocloster clostridioformis]